MIVDSIYRQFLISNRSLIRISTLEDKLGITGKSIHKWVVGKKPLPYKWEEPLKNILFPMVDEQNKVHKVVFNTDKVVFLLESQVLVQFRSLHHSELKLSHFSKRLFKDADVVYLKYLNSFSNYSFRSIFSVY